MTCVSGFCIWKWEANCSSVFGFLCSILKACLYELPFTLDGDGSGHFAQTCIVQRRTNASIAYHWIEVIEKLVVQPLGYGH